METGLSPMHTEEIKATTLETRLDDLQSELELKSKEIDRLKNENKTLVNKYIQLKDKEGLREIDSGMFSQLQPSISTADSLEHDPEVMCIL